MYRRSGSRFNLMTIIILGVIAGVMYLVYDNATLPPAAVLPTLEPLPTDPPLPTMPPAPPTEIPREITAGARLIAPTAGINTSVIVSYLSGASWDVTDLGTQAGYLQGTAWLDRPGNIVLAGHVEMADGRTGVFANIWDIAVGDPLILRQHGVDHVFTVRELLTVQPDDLTVIYPTSSPRLTLITCSNYDFFRDIYQDRYVVIAELASL